MKRIMVAAGLAGIICKKGLFLKRIEAPQPQTEAAKTDALHAAQHKRDRKNARRLEQLTKQEKAR